MTHTNTITINGFSTNNIAPCEAMGLSKCFEAYASIGEEILEDGIGFNPNSGYVYMALENGVSICSMLGNDVEYLVTNMKNGEEHFFDTYEEAESFDPYSEEDEETNICSICNNSSINGESCNCIKQK